MRVKVEAVRANLAEVLRSASTEPVIVSRYGESIAAIVSMSDLEELQRLRGLYRNHSIGGVSRLAFRQ